MPDWHGTTGRDDLVGGSGETQYSTTIDDVTLCSVKPFTDEEIEALRKYFRLLAEKRNGAENSTEACLGCITDGQPHTCGFDPVVTPERWRR